MIPRKTANIDGENVGKIINMEDLYLVEKNKLRKPLILIRITTVFLFSVHISYGKRKYLNQTVFFTKFAKQQIYIQAEGFHP